MGYSPWGCKELDTTEHTHTHTQTRARARKSFTDNTTGKLDDWELISLHDTLAGHEPFIPGMCILQNQFPGHFEAVRIDPAWWANSQWSLHPS